MRSLAVAAVCSAAFFATGAYAQEASQPSSAQVTSAPQVPQTTPAAAPVAPAYSFHNIGDFAITYNIGAANDYAFRGISQTKENPQISGGFDVSYKAMYAGLWSSNVNFKPFGDPRTNTEIDVYGGFKPTFAGFNFDVGAIYYAYGNQPRGGADVDYVEAYGKVTKAFGPLTVGGSVYWSPNFTGEVGRSTYYEGNAAYSLTKKLSLSGAVGRQTFDTYAFEYTTWNLGATYQLTDHIGIDVRYWDTDEHDYGKVYDGRGIVGVKLTF